jgi:hypothetical protein
LSLVPADFAYFPLLSDETKRFLRTFPKKGKAPHEVAMREAWMLLKDIRQQRRVRLIGPIPNLHRYTASFL